MSAIGDAVLDMMGMFEDGHATEQVDELAQVVGRIGAAAADVKDAGVRAQVEAFVKAWGEPSRIRSDVRRFVDQANALSAELGSSGYLAG